MLPSAPLCNSQENDICSKAEYRTSLCPLLAMTMFFGDILRFLVIYTAMVLFASVVRVLCIRIEAFQRAMSLDSVDKINECDPALLVFFFTLLARLGWLSGLLVDVLLRVFAWLLVWFRVRVCLQREATTSAAPCVPQGSQCRVQPLHPLDVLPRHDRALAALFEAVHRE
jgi:hypothetical protein